MVFDYVLWFRQEGIWAARNSKGEFLVKPLYVKATLMDNSNVIEVIPINLARREYFTTKGYKLCEGVDILEICGFEDGYAMASGIKKDEEESTFFIVKADTGAVLSKRFTDKDECVNFLSELRNDYVWSMRANSKK